MNFSPSNNIEHLNALCNETNNVMTLRQEEDLLKHLSALNSDVNFNYHDERFNSALYLAIANNCLQTATYLLHQRSADPNLIVSEGLTAFHIAAKEGNIAAIELLLSTENPQLTKQDIFGETPLFRAIGNAPPAHCGEMVARLLAANKASAFICNEDGMTPIDLALEKHCIKSIELLLALDVPISSRCYSRAGELLVAQSNSSNHRFKLFSTQDSTTLNLLDCSKLIIEAYNKKHLFGERLSSCAPFPGSYIDEHGITILPGNARPIMTNNTTVLAEESDSRITHLTR